MKSLRRLSDESGQTVVFAALCMTILIAFLGLVIDVGNLRYTKRQLQSDADAAALAAGREIRVCGAKAQTLSTCPYMTAAANSALAENESTYTSAAPSTACGGSLPATLALKLEVHTPCSATDPNHGSTAGYIEAVVSKLQPTYFAKVIGFPSVSISARAEAMRNVSPPCIYALSPHDPSAISLGIGIAMHFNCGIVDESDSSLALSSPVCVLVGTSSTIVVHGGVSTLLSIGCPSPQTYAPVPTPADPLAYLPPPPNANDTCGSTTSSPYTGSPTQVNVPLLSGLLSLGKPLVFNPGVYCGGISIPVAIANNIVFNPGTYVLRQGQGVLAIVLGIPILSGATTGGLQMTVSLLSTITGNDVMFYNEGPSGLGPAGSFNITEPLAGASIVSLGQFNLSAPTTGDYAGVLYFQAHGNTTPGGLLLNLAGSSNLQGGIYMPDAAITYGVSALSTNRNFVVAKDINFGVLGLLSMSIGGVDATSSLGSPLVGDDAVLVQ